MNETDMNFQHTKKYENQILPSMKNYKSPSFPLNPPTPPFNKGGMGGFQISEFFSFRHSFMRQKQKVSGATKYIFRSQ